MYRNYQNDTYMDPENPIAKELREQAILNKEVSIQIKRRLESGEELVTIYKHLPAAWFRSSYSSIKAECRIYPFMTSFKINLTGATLRNEGEGRYTLTNPEFDVEVKIIFH